MIRFDPDGPGPAAELVVIGGSFNAAGHLRFENVVAWNGQDWTDFGSAIQISAFTMHNGQLFAAGAFTDPQVTPMQQQG